MKKKMMAILLCITMLVALLPVTVAYATDYYNTRITEMNLNSDGKITSITVQFSTTDTYASDWFLAINDETNFSKDSSPAANKDRNNRFYIPCNPRNQATGIAGMTSAGMPCLASNPEGESDNGNHTMTLNCTVPIEKNANYKLNLWIYIAAAWSGYGNGYYIERTWDLTELITTYEENFTSVLSAGRGMFFAGDGGLQSAKKGEAIKGYALTASYGYYFPENYSWSSGGLSATRVSDSQITVSGKLTANVTATLPDATLKTSLTGISLTTDPEVLEPGVELTAASPTPAGATATYQWYRTNPLSVWAQTSIANANESTYTTTKADIGYRITVKATGTGLYFGTVSDTTTNKVTVPLTGLTLSGSAPIVGEKLTASVAPAGATVSYQWYTNTTAAVTDGALIDGATGADYAPLDSEIGKYLYCVATGMGNYTGTESAVAANAVGGPLSFMDSVDYDVPAGIVGMTYTAATALSAAGGTAPYTFTVDPPLDGLSVDGDNKLVYTRPVVQEETTVAVKVTDDDGTQSTIYVGIGAVTESLVFADSADYDVPAGIVGTTYTAATALSAAGGTAPYTFTVDPPVDGLSVDGDNKLVYTRPVVQEETAAAVKVTDDDGTQSTIYVGIGAVTEVPEAPRAPKKASRQINPSEEFLSADDLVKVRTLDPCGDVTIALLDRDNEDYSLLLRGQSEGPVMAYEIDPQRDGGDAIIMFYVGRENTGKQYTVLHKLANGSIEEFHCICAANGWITVRVKEFSPFMVFAGSVGGGTAASATAVNAKNPDTGANDAVALATALGAMALLGCCILGSKQR